MTAQRFAGPGLAETSAGSVRHFARHLGEMLLAMVAGMMVLGALDRGIVAAAGSSVDDLRDTAFRLQARAGELDLSARRRRAA